jgi:hypothetical protein
MNELFFFYILLTIIILPYLSIIHPRIWVVSSWACVIARKAIPGISSSLPNTKVMCPWIRYKQEVKINRRGKFGGKC